MKYGIASFVITSIIMAVYGISLWTDRTLDFWFTYFKGEVIDIPFWISTLTAIVFNAVILVVNVLSELLRFVV